ncbi:MAG: T9SS type A sorting domain-containing protein, partial [Marinilabiliaceae bacterium]|nr:T9SS type A sorting domain-containing protein [Marinilabiliaceae bacterium]
YTSALVYWVPGTGYPEKGAMLRVSDLLGKTHLQIVCNAIPDPGAVQTLDLGKLPRGVYMVHIQGDNYEKTEKVIKE